MIKLGIPRALSYYRYYPLWNKFFSNLGLEIITSPRTNKLILELGIKSSVDEVCLPVKTFMGHVEYLKDKVDYIFIPRIVSVKKKEYTCPKFMGLPDMVKANIHDLPSIICPTVDLTKRNNYLWKNIWEIGNLFTKNPLKIKLAWNNAYRELLNYKERFYNGELPQILDLGNITNLANNRLNIAVIGHQYLVYDPYLSMSLLNKLGNMACNIYTAEMVSEEIINEEVKVLPKRIFWDFAKDIVGAVFYLAKQPHIDGFIHIIPFGCGPDAMIENLIATYLKGYKKPLLTLTVDEHTGEAGINTRIEAFYDLLLRQVG